MNLSLCKVLLSDKVLSFLQNISKELFCRILRMVAHFSRESSTNFYDCNHRLLNKHNTFPKKLLPSLTFLHSSFFNILFKNSSNLYNSVLLFLNNFRDKPVKYKALQKYFLFYFTLKLSILFYSDFLDM